MPKSPIVRLPPNGKFEVEFTAGVWTDVTADVDLAQSSLTIRQFGRVSALSTPQVAQLNVVLRNFDKVTQAYTGKYAPHNQASPFWPNIQPGKRIRYSYNPGVQRWRFTGPVQSWQPLLVDAFKPYMQITAIDRGDQLQRVNMLSPIRQEITLDAPSYWWPLTDAQGSTQAAEQSGNNGSALAVAGTQANPLTFGGIGAGFGDGSGVLFVPGSLSSGQYLTTSGLLVAATFTVECWFNTAAAPSGSVGLVTLDNPVGGVLGGNPVTVGLNTSRNVTVACEAGSITSSTAASLSTWHHVVLTRSWTPFTASYVLYLDGTSVGTLSGAANNTNWTTVTVGQTASSASSGLYTGNANQVAIYNSVTSATLPTARITAHAAAGVGYYGDRTDQRIARFLGYAGLTTSDWSLDVGQALVNTYPQDGKDALSACQDMAATEGGGAALYVTPDGKVRFASRRYRDNRTPVLTLDMVNDLDTGTYSPSFDNLNLVTQVTVDRSSQPGTVTSQTYSKGVTYPGPATTYTTTDQDALNLAQYLVNSQATPGFRFPQIAVDLATAFNNLYDAVGQLQIGDRIRLTNIPATAYPQTTIDFFLEGWTETVTAGGESYLVVFDVTAADNPPRWKWDTSDWGPAAGAMTLNASITTSLVVATSSGPTFTTTGGAYPLKIQIGEERIQLNSAPGGSTSPQTFSSITRAVDGTTQATQTVGAAITLVSADGWSL